MKKEVKMISGLKVQKEDLKILGPQIALFFKTIRSQKNITQKELSDLSKISLYNIKKLECGKKILSINEAKTLAKIFKISAEKIISCEL